MNRRQFLYSSAGVASAVSMPLALTGCGGSSPSADEGTPVAKEETKTMDDYVMEMEGLNESVARDHVELSAMIRSMLTAPATAKNQVAGVESSSTASMTTSEFFSTRMPNGFEATEAHVNYPFPHYLDTQAALSGTEFWEKAIKAHEDAFLGYEQQITKLMAAMRLYGVKLDTAPATAAKPVAVAAEAESTQVQDLVEQMRSISMPENLITSSSLIDVLIEIFVAIKDYLLNTAFSQFLLNAALSFITKVLESIKTEAMSDLSFDDRNATLISLAKMSIAATAVLALNRIPDVKDETGLGEEAAGNFVAATEVMNSFTAKWLEMSQNLVFGTVNYAIDKIQASADGNESELVDTDLQEQLQWSSSLLVVTSYAIRSVFEFFVTKADEMTGQTAFETGGTADIFKPIFTTESTQADVALAAAPPVVQNETAYASTLNYTVCTTDVTTTSPDIGSDLSADIFSFASELANLAYQFTSQTESDAFEFASQMVEYAYTFTSDIEEDAYNFAMTGMEFGYEFASRGEEVGLMADRILWMAVQIGVMADRIGQMADRIVYTEQLIVYTEMLILEFGLLIYGVIKQMVNLILTGLAIIFDREWYTPTSEDLIVSGINNTITQMLSNMHEYSLAVLDNQVLLQETTQSVLETLPFAEQV